MQTWWAHPTVVFPVYFVILFLAISLVMSYVSGWTALSRKFRTSTPFPGKRWTSQSGTMRWRAQYSAGLTIGCDAEGLYLAMGLLFRFHHPPLRIPWSEIIVSPKQDFGVEMVQFLLGRDLRIPLLLRTRLAEEMAGAAGKSWPSPTVG